MPKAAESGSTGFEYKEINRGPPGKIETVESLHFLILVREINERHQRKTEQLIHLQDLVFTFPLLSPPHSWSDSYESCPAESCWLLFVVSKCLLWGVHMYLVSFLLPVGLQTDRKGGAGYCVQKHTHHHILFSTIKSKKQQHIIIILIINMLSETVVILLSYVLWHCNKCSDMYCNLHDCCSVSSTSIWPHPLPSLFLAQLHIRTTFSCFALPPALASFYPYIHMSAWSLCLSRSK